MASPVESVQALYAAFARGDLPAILDRIAPDCAWESWRDHSMQRARHPLFEARTGRNAAAFFENMARDVQMNEFKVLDVFGNDRQAVAEVEIEYVWKPTGRTVRDQELHLWTFGADGRIVRFRHYIDTAKHLQGAGLSLPPQDSRAAT